MESKFKQLPLKPELVLTKEKLLNKSPNATQIMYQANSNNLIVGLGNSNPSSSALSTKRPKEIIQSLGLRLYQWKISQWGNQIKCQEVDIVSEASINVKQVLISTNQTLGYILDHQNQLYQWKQSDQKCNIQPFSIQDVDYGVTKTIKLHAFDLNNLFFAASVSHFDQHQMIIVQTFDKEIFASLSNINVEKAVFLPNQMSIALVDDLNTVTLFDFETRQILSQLRFPQSDPINHISTSPNEDQSIIVFTANTSTLHFYDSTLTQTFELNLPSLILAYTSHISVSPLTVRQLYSLLHFSADSLLLATPNQIIQLQQNQVTNIIYLESVSARSQLFQVATSIYCACSPSTSNEIQVYQVMTNHAEQTQQQALEKNDDDQEDEDHDIIGEFAKQYAREAKLEEIAEEYKGNAPQIIEEDERSDMSEDQEEEEQQKPAMPEASFKDTGVYKDIAKKRDEGQVFQARQGGGESSELSVLDQCLLHPKSVLVLANQKIEEDSIYDHTDKYNKTRFTNLPQKYIKTNMPVTFHKKIKSSGYGSQPNTLKFSTKQKAIVQKQNSGVEYKVSNDFMQPLPMTIPDELSVLRDAPIHKNAVVKLCYSPLGTKLASISQDTMISVIKTPIFSNQLDLTTLGGHNAQVNSIHFSANDQYLISASSDKTCIVWNLKWQKKGEKLLVLDRLKKNKTTSATDPLQNPLQAQQNPALPDIIRRAQFYYDDRLITLSCGNQLLFYQFELPDQDPTSQLSKDDVKRLQQKGLYKLLQTFTHPTAQHIPSFSFHNHRVKSHIGLVGGSNKELLVYDANANKVLSTLNDGHNKHIHTVKFYEGSYSDAEAYNTFFTASTDNYIKLWDLRVGSPVREFTSHINRSMPIGFDVSNCYRYLISGSEDRSVYIYDIGSGQVIDKTKNLQHGDSVTDVAVNPECLEWATSCIDGHVRVFRYPATKIVRKPKPKNGGGGYGGMMVKGKKASIQEQEQRRILDQFE